MYSPESPFIQLLAGQVRLGQTPFSDRGSRILLYEDPVKPHTLYLKLAERLTALTPGLSAYRQRPPFIRDMQLIDAAGAVLPYQITTYPHALVFETPIGQFVLAFQDIDTLALHPPLHVAAGLRFTVVPDLSRPDAIGGEFKSVRNCAYSTNGRVLLNHVAAESPGYAVALVVEGDQDTAITINIRSSLDLNRTVQPWQVTIAAAEQRWHDWFARVPAVSTELRRHYYYAWWVLGVNLLAPSGLVHRECVAPSKAHYIGAWQWDNCFHVLALRHADPVLALDQVLLMLDHQLPNGMIPDAVYDEGTITRLELPVPAAVTKPPVIAWAVMHLFAYTADIRMLATVYDALVRWNSWWFGMNDEDADGIVSYAHPFSSGLDDSPLWDAGMPVEAVDLNTYLVIQMQSLSRMAGLIGHPQEAALWSRKAGALLSRMIDHFYDPQAGLFWSTHNHTPIRVITPFSLYPLWTSALPSEITARLAAHLFDPSQFWCTYPLPTVALNDPAFNPVQMWRGPTWLNVNYIFVEALQRLGLRRQAAELAERSLRLVMGQRDIFEYYHPLTGEPPMRAAPMFSWSAACFIDMAIALARGSL